MLQEPSFLGTNIMLVLRKNHVTSAQTTLRLGTFSPKGTSCLIRRHFPGRPKAHPLPPAPCGRPQLRADEAGSAFGWVHSVPSTVIVHHNFQRIEELFSLWSRIGRKRGKCLYSFKGMSVSTCFNGGNKLFPWEKRVVSNTETTRNCHRNTC